MIKYIPFLVSIYLLISCKPQVEQKSKSPNVVFFLVDDLGYSDLGCYGSEFYETPNIDKLAAEGVLFTRNYSASTICSPTRASILSGKYPGRLHLTGPIPILGAERRENPKMLDADYDMTMDLEEFTMAEAFKEQGYTTAFLGKWHVAHDTLGFPQFQGFDYNIGGCQHGNPGEYFYPYHGKWRMTPRHQWVEWNTLPDGEPGEYLTDRLTDEAVEIIKNHSEVPFLLYMSHYAVHSPLQAKEELIKKYEAKSPDTVRNHSNASYAAMIESVDESLGRILKTLDSLGLTENTLVVFTSDNGGAHFATNNYPWRGHKGNFYEGGIRVPLIMKFPEKINTGWKTDLKVISIDYYPTILDLCSFPQQPDQIKDGKSFANHILKGSTFDETAFNNRDIFWHFPNYIGAVKNNPTNPVTVIQSGDWKMLQQLEDYSVELYNLKTDPLETTEVSKEYPEIVKQLEEKLEAHRNEQSVQMPRPNPNYVSSN